MNIEGKHRSFAPAHRGFEVALGRALAWEPSRRHGSVSELLATLPDLEAC